MKSSGLYNQDFYAWANEQAILLRSGNFSSIDVENIAEEIESMGRSEKRELMNRLAVLLTHLFKWRFQPSARGTSWQLSIKEQRRRIGRHLADNPSLKATLPEIIEDAYGDALFAAARETGLDLAIFPEICPWPFTRMMDEGFWPESSQTEEAEDNNRSGES